MFLSCKSYCFFIRNIILSQSFDVEGCAGSCSHNCHGVLYLDNHGQELSQLPVWWKSHTWWGFVVLFVKCKFFYGNNSQDYFLRLRYHHHNLLALSLEEKAALVPSFEGQLVPLAQHIVQLRRKTEFTAINQIADRLLQPARRNKRRRCPEEEEVDCYKYICCCRTFY